MKYGAVMAFVAALLLAGCGGDDEQSEDVNFFMGRGDEELGAGRYKEAITSFEKAIQLQPKLASAHEKLALIYDGVYGDTEQARLYYGRCLELGKNSRKKKQLARWIKELEQKAVEDRQYASLAPGVESGASGPVLIAAEIEKDQELLNEIASFRAKLGEKDRQLVEEAEKRVAFAAEISRLNRESEQLKEVIKVHEEEGGSASEGDQGSKDRIAAQQKLIENLRNEKKNFSDEVVRLDKKINELQQEKIDLKARLDQSRKGTATSTETGNPEKKYRDLYRKALILQKAYNMKGEQLDEANKRIKQYLANEKRLLQTINNLRQIPETYAVQQGDTLIKISKKIYGNDSRWRDIFNLNKDRMASENDVKIGVVLRMPQ